MSSLDFTLTVWIVPQTCAVHFGFLLPGNSIQKFTCIAQKCGGVEFPGGPVVWTQCFQCCGQVQSLVGKLHSIAKKQTNKKAKKQKIPNSQSTPPQCKLLYKEWINNLILSSAG